MKRLSAILLLFMVFLHNGISQSAETLSYQAVVRDENNNLVINQRISIRISIITSDVNGQEIYSELQSPQTNSNGLFSIQIGSNSGFSLIDWSSGPLYVKTEIDPNGGTNYTITGVSQLLAVPYALHAKTAENITGGIEELDPIFTNSSAALVSDSHIENLENLSGINTGDQDLSNLLNKTDFNDTLAVIRTEIPDVSKLLAEESDPVFLNWNKNYEDLTNKPVLWDSSYSSIKETPVSISDLSLDANNNRISRISEPIEAQDAATKAYVDLLELKINQLEDMLINAGLYTVSDIDGNNYKVVNIGDQTWMAESLKAIRYSNGDSIEIFTGAGKDFDAYVFISETYGNYYTWQAVNDERSVCPSGWHLPQYEEYQEMIDYLGGAEDASIKLRDTTGFHMCTTEATNETGFTALSGGYRSSLGLDSDQNFSSYFWCTPAEGEMYASYLLITCDFLPPRATLSNTNLIDLGFNIRCVKDD